MREIKTRSEINGTIRLPGSKSITHRAIIVAGLAGGESLLHDYLSCEDTNYTARVIQSLGSSISYEGKDMRITGTGGDFNHSQVRQSFYLGNSGTSMRLLLSVLALSRGQFLVDGSSRMRKRPLGGLVNALKQWGADIRYLEEEKFPPLLLTARGIKGGPVELELKESSQPLSSLLLASPYAKGDAGIKVSGDLVSRPYVDITLSMMREFGVSVSSGDYKLFHVPSGQSYKAREYSIEGDVSSASYFWAAAAVTGGTVITENIYPGTTRQGDIRFLEIFEEMGCTVERLQDRVIVQGGSLKAVDVDMSAMPDMVPTLAALALFARGKTVIRNVSHLRYKESDRLKAIALNWSQIGARAEESDDGLIIHGGSRLSGNIVDPYNDHRLAMSMAVIGLRVPGLKIKNWQCVGKSFPGFWDLWSGI